MAKNKVSITTLTKDKKTGMRIDHYVIPPDSSFGPHRHSDVE
jgi:hypothetical protein